MSSFLKEGDHEVVEDFKNPSALRASPFPAKAGHGKKGDKYDFIKYSASQALQLKIAGPDNHR